jgi:hypothetical protein
MGRMGRMLGFAVCLTGAVGLAWLATIAPPRYYGLFLILASLLGVVASLAWTATRRR